MTPVPYGDLDRPPLRAEALARALAPEGWRLEVVDSTPSTNDLVKARASEAPGLVVVAEEQSAGRGRLDRSWESPPRAGLTFSVLLNPPDLAWVTLLGGLAVATAVREQTGVDAVLKWPNDVLVAERKLAGLLAEAVPVGDRTVVVLGIGLNVTTTQSELPHEGATSLRLEEAEMTDRDTLLRAILRELAKISSPKDYRALCATLGRRVEVHLPGGEVVAGTADNVDTDGRLVVDGTPYSAGDVVHLR